MGSRTILFLLTIFRKRSTYLLNILKETSFSSTVFFTLRLCLLLTSFCCTNFRIIYSHHFWLSIHSLIGFFQLSGFSSCSYQEVMVRNTGFDFTSWKKYRLLCLYNWHPLYYTCVSQNGQSIIGQPLYITQTLWHGLNLPYLM